MTEINFCFNGGLSLILQMGQVPRVGDNVQFFVGDGGFTETKVVAVVWVILDGKLEDQADTVYIELEWLDGLPSDELFELYGKDDAMPDIEMTRPTGFDSEEVKEGD